MGRIATYITILVVIVSLALSTAFDWGFGGFLVIGGVLFAAILGIINAFIKKLK